VQTGVPLHEHVPQLQSALQVWVPSVSHVAVIPGVQAPSSVHALHCPHVLHVWLPHLPHASVVPPVHTAVPAHPPATQTPAVHFWLALHALPHAPQLSSSDWVSTHVPLQSTEVSPLQRAPHAASEQ
jgi:hypothetical protein